MKNILQISSLVISIFIVVVNANDIEDYFSIGTSIRNIEKNISCQKLNTKLERIECLKERIEYNINKIYKNKAYKKVQLGKFSKENNAKELIKKYNSWKKNKKKLKTSKAKIKKCDENFFCVFVSQNGINSKELKKKLKKTGWMEAYIPNQKIILNMKDKIIKEMKPHNKVKILQQKVNCYTKYKSDKSKLIKCLKEEAIHAIQIHSFFDKGLCERAVKNWRKKHDKKNKFKAQCEKKRINSTERYYVMIEIKSFAKTQKEKMQEIKKREQEIKKEKSDAFIIRKTEILIK